MGWGHIRLYGLWSGTTMNYMHRGSTRGFTLIELLVVIAIIGVLSSVVLSSLNTSRNKSGDSAVQANLQTVRAQAELYYSVQGSYGTTPGSYYSGDCSTSGTMFRLTGGNATGEKATISAVITNAIQAAYDEGGGDRVCRTDAARELYMVAVRLKSSSAYWCVDNTGAAKSISALPASGIVACQ